MKKKIEIIFLFIVLPFFGFSCFGDVFSEISAEEKALSYKERRDRQKKFHRERRKAFADYKKEQNDYQTERRRARLRRQNQSERGLSREGFEKKWNREQAVYHKARRSNTQKYIEQRDRHRKKNQTGKDLLERLKPDRELVL